MATCHCLQIGFPLRFRPDHIMCADMQQECGWATTDRAAVNLPGLQPGDHVLVVWVANDPVVVDVITR